MEDSGAFMRKLRAATTGRFQLSTDAYATYESTVTWHLGQRVDYGQVSKIFGSEPGKDAARKYSPGKIISSNRTAVLGNPSRDQICTSHCANGEG